jgi:hypothetical protein
MTIPADLAARIERMYEVEHWRVGTIARQLHVHRDICSLKCWSLSRAWNVCPR